MLRRKWETPIHSGANYRLSYVDNGFDGSTSGLSYRSTYVFRGNSLFDPDYTGFGVQPYGYDQLVPTLYNYWTVRGSSITVSYVTTTECSQLKVFLLPNRSPTIANSDPSDLRMIPGVRMRRYSDGAGLSRRNVIKAYISSRRILQYAGGDSVITGTDAGNPTLVWYWLVIFDTSDVGEAVGIKFDVRITYYTHFIRQPDALNES